MHADARGRLTLPDLLFFLAGLAFLAALWPVVWDVLAANVREMKPGTALLIRVLLPGIVLIMFTGLYVKVTRGVV